MTAKRPWNDPYRQKRDPRATVTRHRSELLAADGVSSVGLGFDESHRTVIVVGVVSEEALGSAQIPSDLEGVPVQIRVVGGFTTKGQDDD